MTFYSSIVLVQPMHFTRLACVTHCAFRARSGERGGVARGGGDVSGRAGWVGYTAMWEQDRDREGRGVKRDQSRVVRCPIPNWRDRDEGMVGGGQWAGPRDGEGGGSPLSHVIALSIVSTCLATWLYRGDDRISMLLLGALQCLFDSHLAAYSPPVPPCLPDLRFSQ